MIDPALEPEVHGTASRRQVQQTRSGAAHVAQRCDFHTPSLRQRERSNCWEVSLRRQGVFLGCPLLKAAHSRTDQALRTIWKVEAGTMDIQRAVKAFIADGKDLYHRLRSSGERLSDLDLIALREQLYILDTEAGHLQELKDSRSDGAEFIFSNRPPVVQPFSRKAA